MSFEQQLIDYTPKLKLFALSLTKNMADSEDLLGSTILSALSNKSKYKPDTNFKAWVSTIMRNSFINDYRKIKRFGHTVELSELSIDNICLENKIDSKILFEQVCLFIDNQSSKQSTPIIMYSQGYGYEEISEITNEPIGTVKSRIFKMREKLNNHIQK